ncbi:helix-turn-helix domain-containing protein [Couchioplanes caeruleus]|uniref:DynR7-like protein n=2 Tax=Couchioplanes caeruleus TaxID=56438 RepID=A0A1K0FTN8_9ACTN|nr:AraC family transcriptional regulator [Couchioplanes caeruleus]OJF16231.1 DynR7-like protein [Couchioplanes caeruleus subsp. caeruleus]ROP28783.1 AraC-like DNA-binding protein [Couchioplanes caeruleus]
MSTATEAASNDTRAAHLEAVTRAIGVMRRRLAHPQPLRALAGVAAFSPFYFHQMFREVTAMTPARFLAVLRMAEARRLLLHSNLPVRQVGAMVGYTSPGTFSAQFALLTGTPPSRFRTQARALGDVRAAGARWWSRSRPPAADGAPVVTLSRAPDPGSLVCVCLVPAGSLRVHRGSWTPSTGSPWIPVGVPPPCGEYAAFCLVIPAGAQVVDALVDDVPGSLRLGRAALSVCAHPPPATARTALRWPAPTDPPVTALLPLARPPGAAG